jgi:hypothetical protein
MAHPLTSGAAVLERAERFGRGDGSARILGFGKLVLRAFPTRGHSLDETALCFRRKRDIPTQQLRRVHPVLGGELLDPLRNLGLGQAGLLCVRDWRQLEPLTLRLLKNRAVIAERVQVIGISNDRKAFLSMQSSSKLCRRDPATTIVSRVSPRSKSDSCGTAGAPAQFRAHSSDAAHHSRNGGRSKRLWESVML